jgi:hypothetical protein
VDRVRKPPRGGPKRREHRDRIDTPAESHHAEKIETSADHGVHVAVRKPLGDLDVPVSATDADGAQRPSRPARG